MQKRTQFFLVSLGSLLVFHTIYYLSVIYALPIEVVLFVWLLLVTVLFTYVIEKNYRFPEQLMFAVLPLLSFVTLIILSFTLSFVVRLTGLSLIVSLASVFALYVLLLVLNVINAATVRTVPLLKAAQTTLLVYSVVLMTIWVLFILTSTVNIWIAGWLWFVFCYLLSLSVIYFGQVEVVREFTGVIKLPLIESLVIAFFQAFTIIVTNGWPMPMFVRGMYWIISLFVMILLFRARRQRKLTKKMVRDFTLIQWALFVVVLMSGVRFG